MKLESQVCSLELSKKLLTLGVKQKSIFVWEYWDDSTYGVRYKPFAVVPGIHNKLQLFPAYTVAELGEILPKYITTVRETAGYGCYLNETPILRRENDKCEANARAKMVIHLLESKLMEI